MKQQLLLLWLAGFLLSVHTAAATQPITTCKTISASGSYELMKNITANGDCIILAADGITLDLGGYTMRGDGTGSAILTDGPARQLITVRNGVILNFNSGVALYYTSAHSRIEKLTVIGVAGSTGVGIGANDSSIVIENTVSNMGVGIAVGSRSIVRDNTATFNSDGFNIGLASTVIGNVAGNNARDGFQIGHSSTVVNNTAFDSGRYGFLRQGGNYLGNTASMNQVDVYGPANNSEHNAPAP